MNSMAHCFSLKLNFVCERQNTKNILPRPNAFDLWSFSASELGLKVLLKSKSAKYCYYKKHFSYIYNNLIKLMRNSPPAYL